MGAEKKDGVKTADDEPELITSDASRHIPAIERVPPALWTKLFAPLTSMPDSVAWNDPPDPVIIANRVAIRSACRTFRGATEETFWRNIFLVDYNDQHRRQRLLQLMSFVPPTLIRTLALNLYPDSDAAVSNILRHGVNIEMLSVSTGLAWSLSAEFLSVMRVLPLRYLMVSTGGLSKDYVESLPLTLKTLIILERGDIKEGCSHPSVTTLSTDRPFPMLDGLEEGSWPALQVLMLMRVAEDDVQRLWRVCRQRGILLMGTDGEELECPRGEVGRGAGGDEEGMDVEVDADVDVD